MLALTPAQIALINSPQQLIKVGLDLLDSNDMVAADLSADFAREGTVSHQNYANIHGTLSGLRIARSLNWGVDRVRPYMTIDDGIRSSRFNLGVYIVTTPSQAIGTTIPDYSVTAYDKLYLLNAELGDSYWVDSGTSYLSAVQAALTSSGTGLTATLEGGSTAVLSTPMVWALDGDKPVTWLQVINDLLGAIGYQGLWSDNDGKLRSGPYQTLASRGPEWAFNVADAATSIVYQDRTVETDAFRTYNWWRYIRKGYALPVSEANGQYTVDRSNGARKLKKVRTIDAADQQSLIALAERDIEADMLRTRTVKIKTGALPALGHFDVFTYNDPDIGSYKAMARSWSLDLATGQTQIEMEVTA